MSQSTAVTAPARTSFPSPYEQDPPAGAEGWKDLYAYNLIFQENRGDIEERKFWFCDSQHWPTVLKPFETIGPELSTKCLGQFNTRYFLVPPANGLECRVHQGYVYHNPVTVEQDEAATRVPEFLRRAGYYFEHWDALLDNWKDKVLAVVPVLGQHPARGLRERPALEQLPRRPVEHAEARHVRDEVRRPARGTGVDPIAEHERRAERPAGRAGPNGRADRRAAVPGGVRRGGRDAASHRDPEPRAIGVSRCRWVGQSGAQRQPVWQPSTGPAAADCAARAEHAAADGPRPGNAAGQGHRLAAVRGRPDGLHQLHL